jgi:peptidoglycan/xylan/chitin deacetylase (PgdA/CDA1 family)
VTPPGLWPTAHALVCVTLTCVLFGCNGNPRLAAAVTASPGVPAQLPTSRTAAPPVRPQLDGHSFPDKLLALTWDDGPDANTLALASYLNREHVSATFFVVREWSHGLSADPGSGKREFETGYRYLPILGDLVGLGHRVGNHTLNHVLLSRARPDMLDLELKENQENIDPFLTNELRLFRAPGGAWSAPASRVTDADPYLYDLVGPIRWDVDRKDWESSLHCRSSSPATECEPGGRGRESRVKPEVVAKRYLASIASARHGVVLFHDRVGDVGSSYALEVAEHVIPALRAQGYVFVAPVLEFVEAQPRLASRSDDVVPLSLTGTALQLGDLDGDGRADACLRVPGDHRCVRSVEIVGTEEDRRPRTVFEPSVDGTSPASPERGQPSVEGPFATCSARFESEDIQLADVDGDGRADICASLGFGIACAKVLPSGECGPAEKWSLWDDQRSRDPVGAATRFGDVDGDGKADACVVSERGIGCALSSGHSFGRQRSWAVPMPADDDWLAPGHASTIALADVDGDGRADACGQGRSGIVCARSTGRGFGRAEVWSSGEGFAGASRITFGDVNGDRRADVCAVTRTAQGSCVECSLSNGDTFTPPSVWLAAESSPDAARLVRAASLAMGDVNGDGRADLCGYDPAGTVCALAP